MSLSQSKSAILLLDDGTIYKGKAAGQLGTKTGEICFNTGMTGYQEIFTDPSYFGQMITTTNVHIGNYGVKKEDTESANVQIAGLICKSFIDKYSRPMADQDINSYFIEQEVSCIYDVDTRSIVKHIRNKGAMNCIISSEIEDIDELKEILAKVPSMKGLELASRVTTAKAYSRGNEDSDTRIAVIDYGVKNNILESLIERGAYLKIFPAKTPFEQIANFDPDGYFLSNGPGDPSAMDYAVDTVKTILTTGKPVFGICLGHQLLALAAGVDTYKMHHGHRGINHPVKNLNTGKCEITSQNHGFGVNAEQILSNSEEIEVTHMNLNDNTIEGIRLKGKPAFSVQYHPEAAPGPHDSRYLFDQFLELIQNNK